MAFDLLSWQRVGTLVTSVAGSQPVTAALELDAPKVAPSETAEACNTAIR
jgi:hypothetical protein